MNSVRDEGSGVAMRSLRRLSLLPAATLLLCACAPVKPWQHATLARPDMQTESEPLQASIQDHIYFSKEASSGGRGFGGGGCGCN
jgi:hypothetical protein